MSELMITKIGMAPSHPGYFISSEIMDVYGLTLTKTAELLGVRRATLSDFVNEKSSLSPEMALRIEKAFGVSMDTLIQMQAWYDCHVMRLKEDTIDVKRYEASRN